MADVISSHSTSPIWVGGSGSLAGANWITRYRANDTANTFLDYTTAAAGAQDTIQFLPTSYFTYKSNNPASLAANGTLSGAVSVGSAYFDNTATYILSGSIAVSNLVRQRSGSVTVTGQIAAARLEVTGGALGHGTMRIAGGGQATLSDYALSQGVVQVDGAGSALTAAHLSVGSAYDVVGQLTVTAGAKVKSTAETKIGNVGKGFVTVDGTGSSLTVGTFATLGGGGELHITAGGLVQVGTLGSGGTLTVTSGAISMSGTQSLLQVDQLTLDGASLLSGSGRAIASVRNDGHVTASGGNLIIGGNITGNGALIVGRDAALRVDGAVAATETLSFAADFGQLLLSQPSRFAATITGFAAADQIDLLNTQANEAEFDPATGRLLLYQTTYGANTVRTQVAALLFSGQSTRASFALAPDMGGGTLVTPGTDLPDVRALATFAQAVYDEPATVSVANATGGQDTFQRVDQILASVGGFYGAAFKSNNQIVIAYRGTQEPLDYVADSSWAFGSPDFPLRDQVRDASTLLARVRAAYPAANITLTGHSLGGALAQIIGLASGYAVTGFNAPGMQQFQATLALELRQAAATSDGTSHGNVNYRLSADYISRAGTPTGETRTLGGRYPETPINTGANHAIASVIYEIDAAVPYVVGPPPRIPTEDFILAAPGVITTAGIRSLAKEFSGTIALANKYYGLDPAGHTTYELTAKAGSPAIASLQLPTMQGVTSYILSLQQNGSWTAPILLAAGTTYDLPASTPTTGLRFETIDAAGTPVLVPEAFAFTLRFTATGAFDGTLVERQARLMQADPLFDPAYYLAKNPDVAAAKIDPYTHYMTAGWKEGRNPNAYFDTTYYLKQNKDVAAAGINPLLHFETSGWKEGRQPSLAFSDAAYLNANADVTAAGIDPLAHYLQDGSFEGRAAPLNGPALTSASSADPLVAASYAVGQVATIIPTTFDASAWYHGGAWKQGINPNAWFDTSYYLARNPDVKAAGIDPLLHYETYGWKEGRDPSLLFSDAKYLQANPDVAAARIDPLTHYISSGKSEGRMAFLTGTTAAADPLVDAAYYDKQLGATLIPTGGAGAQQAASSYNDSGWKAGLNPDAWFDTAYYLSHNPDVAAAKINPLTHFENFGWKEGRDPSAQFSVSKYLAAYSDVRAAQLDPLVHYVQFGAAEGRLAFHV